VEIVVRPVQGTLF